MMSVLVGKAFFSLPLRILFLWEALGVKLSCFHVKGAFYRFVFQGALSCLLCKRAFSPRTCVCVCGWHEASHHGWWKTEVGEDSVAEVVWGGRRARGHNLVNSFWSRKSAIDPGPTVDIKWVKCADDLCEPPPAAVRGVGGAVRRKLSGACAENYSSLTF